MKKILVFIVIITLILLYNWDYLLKFWFNNKLKPKSPIIISNHTYLSNINSSSMTQHHLEQDNLKKYYKILLWTQLFSSSEWATAKLDKLNCSYSNCILNDNKRDLPKSDVILFHWRDIDIRNLPEYHVRGQKWVLLNYESPNHTPEDVIKPLVKHINWIMSYRSDSDIYVPYGLVSKCKTNKRKNTNNFDKKNKNIAWIVSNCNTPSNRESLVNKLNKYIDIDVYGACGQSQCSRNDSSCFDMIAQNYRFYLAFENSLCKDYVTEKLFRTIQYDIIPIVYGLANYKQILPNKSYINVFDYTSVKQLADHLKVIASDQQMYNSYFEWKSEYCVQNLKTYDFFCDLCQKLNLYSNKKIKIKPNLINWWFKDAKCHGLADTLIADDDRDYSKPKEIQINL